MIRFRFNITSSRIQTIIYTNIKYIKALIKRLDIDVVRTQNHQTFLIDNQKGYATINRNRTESTIIALAIRQQLFNALSAALTAAIAPIIITRPEIKTNLQYHRIIITQYNTAGPPVENPCFR